MIRHSLSKAFDTNTQAFDVQAQAFPFANTHAFARNQAFGVYAQYSFC